MLNMTLEGMEAISDGKCPEVCNRLRGWLERQDVESRSSGAAVSERPDSLLLCNTPQYQSSLGKDARGSTTAQTGALVAKVKNISRVRILSQFSWGKDHHERP